MLASKRSCPMRMSSIRSVMKTMIEKAVEAKTLQPLTLVLVLRDVEEEKNEGKVQQQVLLGLKKRGFGMGKWNGFGGKMEDGDANITAAAKRELQEESFLDAKVSDLHQRGMLLFTFPHKKQIMQVHIFTTTVFVGDPLESDEMLPQWYNVEDIPYDKMWADDKYWLPHVLEGKDVYGYINFAEDEATILENKLLVE